MSQTDDLTRALDALAIASPAAFTFAGRVFNVAPAAPQNVSGYPIPSDPLVRDLQMVFYTYCYSRHFTGVLPDLPAVNAAAPDHAFLQQLSAANQTQTRWDAGWQVYAVGANGEVWVQKGERQRSAAAGEYLSAGAPGMPPQPGSSVQLFLQRESGVMQPGMYFIFSEIPTDVWDEFKLLRFYFHIEAAGVAALIRYITAQLNRYLIPFRMKALADPRAYDRTDAAVLYTARRYHHLVSRILLNMPAEVRERLREKTPLFTAQLAPGIGIAEEPNTGESFGMHRSRLVAEGVAGAFARGTQRAADRLAAVAERFSANGLDLARPHLSPGSMPLPQVEPKVGIAYA
jgi:hypothetical protein